MTVARRRHETVAEAVSLNELTPIKTRRTFEEVSSQLRDAVASGQIRPGDRLPSERDLAESFNVSRTAVREALRTLESAGLIELRKGRNGGAIIRAGSPDSFNQSIHDMVSLGALRLSDLTEARIDITDIVIRHFCERAGEADLEALERNVERTAMLNASDQKDAIIDTALAFHHLLAVGTRNHLLVVVVDALAATLRDFLDLGARYPQNKLVLSRRRLVKHLRRRDAAAASAEMTKNLIELHKRILARESVEPS
jgi:GntR family transcriptional repressor for pyruvate dehydrogenase complex